MGIEPVVGDVPARLSITAPTMPGPDRSYSVLLPWTRPTGSPTWPASRSRWTWGRPPVDTTPPVLTGIPAPQSALTSGDLAVVTWPLPTATDETDPSPSVACAPPSGSAFPIGNTTVTCTATDASGNQGHPAASR